MMTAYLSLGSNLGDRISYIQQAASSLAEVNGVTILQTSTFYETEPWNMDSKIWFVNAVMEIETSLSPQELLNECQRIERQLGKVSSNEGRYADRTIDIDILFFGADIINDEGIVIPHRFMHLRAFTLVPLLELIPDFIHPVLHKSIADLHSDLTNPEMVVLYGTRVEM